MELNRPVVYLGIAIIGVVVSSLYWLVDHNQASAFMWAYITVYCIVGLRFFFEYMYFRRNNAIPSTLQFVGLPYVVLLVGSIVGPFLPSEMFVFLAIDVVFPQFYTMTLASLSLIPPLLILFTIFSRLHSRRWLGFAVRRSLYYSRRVPFVVNFMMSIFLLVVLYYQHIVDVFLGVFLGLWLFQMGKYYVIPWIRREGNSSSSRYRRTNQRRVNPQVRSRLRSSSSTNSTSRLSRSRSVPTSQRGGTRRVRTAYSGKRDVPVRSRLKEERTRNAVVDPGREVVLPAKHFTRVDGDSTSRFLPNAHVSKKDMSCTICYDQIKPSDGTIILCPHCKFPMHEGEFLSWMQMSNLCPRCSKEFSKKEMKTPTYRIDAREYVKLLNRLPKSK